MAKKNKANMPEKTDQEKYFDESHRLGRIGIIGAVFVLLGMPTILGLVFDSMPSFVQVIQSSIGLLAIFLPITITEVISYTPILGSTIYLTLTTGEVTNIKMPAVINALKIANVESGTEDADVISSIAVGVASFITIVIVTVGVVLMIPLQPLLTQPSVMVATSNILPALFGTLALALLTKDLGGGIKAEGRMKGMIIPVIIMIALTLVDNLIIIPTMGISIISTFQGVLILLMLPVAYYGTKYLYNRGKIKVILPENDEASTED